MAITVDLTPHVETLYLNDTNKAVSKFISPVIEVLDENNCICAKKFTVDMGWSVVYQFRERTLYMNADGMDVSDLDNQDLSAVSNYQICISECPYSCVSEALSNILGSTWATGINFQGTYFDLMNKKRNQQNNENHEIIGT